MITIIDYGLGNLGSVFNMFKWIGEDSEITSDRKRIESASKLLLPGVGSFDRGVIELKQRGIWDLLNELVKIKQKPILGICLGMQLLTDSSEEGSLTGLGWIPASTTKFKFDDNQYKVPHMGWNKVSSVCENPLILDLSEDAKFYFVHSYYVKVKNEADSLLKTKYGGTEFDAAVHKGNVWGTQFHPEKSHKYGMLILKNFAKI